MTVTTVRRPRFYATSSQSPASLKFSVMKTTHKKTDPRSSRLIPDTLEKPTGQYCQRPIQANTLQQLYGGFHKKWRTVIDSTRQYIVSVNANLGGHAHTLLTV